MGQLDCDNGSENKGLTEQLIKRYHIRNDQIASYHSQGNALVEQGHNLVLNTLAKLEKKWLKNLPLMV